MIKRSFISIKCLYIIYLNDIVVLILIVIVRIIIETQYQPTGNADNINVLNHRVAIM